MRLISQRLTRRNLFLILRVIENNSRIIATNIFCKTNMPGKKKSRKLNKQLRIRLAKELREEKERLKELKLNNPEMFRRCGNKPCCQAMNTNGTPCTRPAMTEKTYVQSLRCCYLCWQHSLIYGVYVLFKIAKSAAESQLSWEEYCSIHPDKCDTYIQVQDSYE